MKFGVADFGMSVWDGGLFDLQGRLEGLKAIGYDGWVTAEMIPNYKYYTETIIYNTSKAMDAILGR